MFTSARIERNKAAKRREVWRARLSAVGMIAALVVVGLLERSDVLLGVTN